MPSAMAVLFGWGYTDVLNLLFHICCMERLIWLLSIVDLAVF